MSQVAFEMNSWSDDDNKIIATAMEKYKVNPLDIDSFFCMMTVFEEIAEQIGSDKTDDFVAVLRDYISKVEHPNDTISNKVPQELENEINRILRNIKK